MKNKKKTGGIWVDVVVLVICLAIVTSCISSGMLAKYASSASNLSEKGSAAAFNVSATLNDTEGTINDAASSAKYKLALKNDSDVAVRYTVIIEFSGEAKGLIVEIEGKQVQIKEGRIAVFNDVDTLDPHEKKDITVTISKGSFEGSATLDFTARVKFVQVD